jgi:hypothetical protein
MIVTKPLDLGLLTEEMTAASVPHNRLLTVETGVPGEVNLLTYDEDGQPTELPPEAIPVVAAHVAPPRVIEYASQTSVEAIARTTDATPLEVFRFPCTTKHLYRANLRISGVDAGNFASKIMEGRFTWKRPAAVAVVVGLTVVSDIHDTVAASWLPNYAAQGTDVVFTVQGAAGRTIDWLLVGEVDAYAPEGLPPPPTG